MTKNKESYGDFVAWKEHGHCTMLNKKKNSLYIGELEEGFYEGFGKFLPDRSHHDYREMGHYKRDQLDGFANVTKKGGNGFTGVYRDGRPHTGTHQRRN